MSAKKNTILVVDDEAQIRKMLNIFLDAAGFRVEESETGKQALRMGISVKPQLILLDLGLADMDGKEVIASIRQRSDVPIIVMSVRALDADIVAALEAGADDYVVKPFHMDVLIARVNANLRKASIREAGEPELINGPLRMDLLNHEVYCNRERVMLTPKEYELLRYFMINRGKMLMHKQILSEVWGPAHSDNMQYLRVYVGQVRSKLGDHPTHPTLIVTEPGVGYRMEIVNDVPAHATPQAVQKNIAAAGT